MKKNVLAAGLLAFALGAPSGAALAAQSPSAAPQGGRVSATLAGVAVVSPSDVWAVGSKGDATLVRHWDGSAWARIPSPSVDGASNVLAAVTVVGPDDVWAVGSSSTSGGSKVLIEHWDGSAWTIVPGVNPGEQENYLTAVSGTAPDDVWAVGLFVNPGGSSYSMALHWNGSRWSRSELFKRPYGRLNGVVALAATDAWAVGGQASQRSVATHWNGSWWAKVSSPNRGGSLTVYSSVDAIAANDVWIVGYYGTAGGDQPISVHWDGTRWGVVSTPSPGTARLRSVSAISSTDVWAVGFSEVQPFTKPVAEHWDGSSWAAVATPDLGRASGLNAVSAYSSSFAVAVGAARRDGSPSTILTEFWNGSAWSKGRPSVDE